MFEPYHSSLTRAVTDDRLREAAAARQRATWNRDSGLLHRLRHTITAWLERHTVRPLAARHEYDGESYRDGHPDASGA